MTSYPNVYANCEDIVIPAAETNSNKRKTDKNKKVKNKAKNKKKEHIEANIVETTSTVEADAVSFPDNKIGSSIVIIDDNTYDNLGNTLSKVDRDIDTKIRPAEEDQFDAVNNGSTPYGIYEELPSSPVLLNNPDNQVIANFRSGRADQTLVSAADSGFATDDTDYEIIRPVDATGRVAGQFGPSSRVVDIGKQPSIPSSSSVECASAIKSSHRSMLETPTISQSLSAENINRPTGTNDIGFRASSTSALVTELETAAGSVDGSNDDKIPARVQFNRAASCDDVLVHHSGSYRDDLSVGSADDVTKQSDKTSPCKRGLRDVYVAMYKYDADDGDYNEVDVEEILTFDVHDVIYFLGERRGRWMKGQLRDSGEIGWFPDTHVRQGISATSLMKPTKEVDQDDNGETSTSAQHKDIHQQPMDTFDEFDDDYDDDERASSLYVASYPYVATHVGDVTFNAGDVIRVTEINDNGWWRGTVNASGLTGFFPGSYLKSIDDRDDSRLAVSETDISTLVNSQLPSADDSQHDNDVVQKRNKKQNPKRKTNALSNFFSTLPRRFTSSSDAQLVVAAGDKSTLGSNASGDGQKKTRTKGKKNTPALPSEWMHANEPAGVVDTSVVLRSTDVGLTAPDDVCSDKVSSRKSKALKTSAVSAQLDRILVKNVKLASEGKDSLPRSANHQRPKSAGDLLDTPDKQKSLTHQYTPNVSGKSSPLVAPPVAAKKMNLQNPKPRQSGLFASNQKLFKKKSATEDVQFKSPPKVANRKAKSMSMGDLSELDANDDTGTFCDNLQKTDRMSMSSLFVQQNAEVPKLESRQAGAKNTNSNQEVTTGINDRPPLNAYKRSMSIEDRIAGCTPSGNSDGLTPCLRVDTNAAKTPPVTKPPVTTPNKRSTIAAIQFFLTNQSAQSKTNRGIDKRKSTAHHTTSVPKQPLPTESQTSPSVRLPHSGSESDVVALGTDSWSANAPVNSRSGLISGPCQLNASTQPTPSVDSEPVQRASTSPSSTSTGGRRTSSTLKPPPPPKPIFLRRKSIDDVNNSETRRVPLPTRSTTITNDGSVAEVQTTLRVRPEFQAPFPKPPRRHLKNQGRNLTVSNVQTVVVEPPTTLPRPRNRNTLPNVQQSGNVQAERITVTNHSILKQNELPDRIVSEISSMPRHTSRKPLPLKPKPVIFAIEDKI